MLPLHHTIHFNNENFNTRYGETMTESREDLYESPMFKALDKRKTQVSELLGISFDLVIAEETAWLPEGPYVVLTDSHGNLEHRTTMSHMWHYLDGIRVGHMHMIDWTLGIRSRNY